MKVLAIPLLLLGLGALALVGGNLQAPAIERDIARRARLALDEADAAWAAITVDGRDLTLTGAAPTPARRARAADAVAALRGVRVLADHTTVEAPASDPIAACQQSVRRLLRTQSIRFQSGRAVIDPAAFPLLDRILTVLQGCPDAAVQVGGHTDTIGDDATNRKLSEARARSVVDYLAAHGVARARLTAVGFGESQPIASNATAEGRRRNRRIEFVLWRMKP